MIEKAIIFVLDNIIWITLLSLLFIFWWEEYSESKHKALMVKPFPKHPNPKKLDDYIRVGRYGNVSINPHVLFRSEGFKRQVRAIENHKRKQLEKSNVNPEDTK